MHKNILPTYYVLVILTLAALSGCQVSVMNSAAIKPLFADPPCPYSSGPLWVWNDLLTDEQVVGTLHDLASQQVKQVWVHPRPGLMTPYLSEEWFRLWQLAVAEAERLDMNVWIYDENSYPSGFAGGLVPEAMPESRGRGLAMREAKQPPPWSDDLVAVYHLDDSGYENITRPVQAGDTLPEARYLICSVVRAPSGPWFGGKWYVDVLYPGVTEKFIELTLEPYRRHFGEQFGKRIPGTFTDEPHLRPAGGLPWTDHLPQAFEQRWGYSLLEHLPCMSYPVGEYKKVRHNYFQVLLDEFSRHWGKPLHDYCGKHNLAFTGHYWEHEWPKCLRVPDNMAAYAWHQVPAIDTLCNEYAENTHSQFGNVRAVRELSSVANQLGRSRTLCEAYGAGGWDMRFEDMKRIGDWLYVLGVNTLNQHLSYITIRGARKRDHPPSFSYHEPWWEAYHVQAAYFARLSVALSHGQQINPVLLIEPTTTAWMYQADDGRDPHLKKIGETFQQLVMDLERHQVAYDIGCEDILARLGTLSGSSKGAKLKVAQREYSTVVIPPLTENLNVSTTDLLMKYVDAGGTVLCCDDPPTLIDGRPSERGKTLAGFSSWRRIKVAELPTVLLATSQNGLGIHRNEGDKGILFHHRRKLADGDLLFLVNTSIESASSGTIESGARGVELWDPETGNIEPYQFERTENGLKTTFELSPCGSLLLFLSDKQSMPASAAAEQVKMIEPIGMPIINRLDPNVLTLDYVDITAGGETKKDIYFYKASKFAFQTHGLESNPWDCAVQFQDDLITRRFPLESGFEVAYRFTIEGPVPPNLSIIIERPDLYTITCNGQQVIATPDAWWLDRSWGRIDITSLAQVGMNTVTLSASPFTILHEIEPAYLLGDFTLQPREKGFVIVADRGLHFGRWNEQGHPLYGHGVTYTEKFDVTAPSPETQHCRYMVSLPSWYGSVARVVVNGQLAGYIHHRPWKCDVTERIAQGMNTVEVICFGTLKNTLGPHHGNPPLGRAWPHAFQNAPDIGPPPGSQYATVGYGLFEPFVLERYLSPK